MACRAVVLTFVGVGGVKASAFFRANETNATAEAKCPGRFMWEFTIFSMTTEEKLPIGRGKPELLPTVGTADLPMWCWCCVCQSERQNFENFE